MYLKLNQETYVVVSNEAVARYEALPLERQPTLYADDSPEVLAFLAARIEAAKPKEVTMRQGRLALLQAGLLQQVESAINGMNGATGAAAAVEWEYSNTLKRSQPLVIQLGTVLGLNSAQLDALFLTASTL